MGLILAPALSAFITMLIVIVMVGLITVAVEARIRRVERLRASYERYLRTLPLFESEIQAELKEWDAA